MMLKYHICQKLLHVVHYYTVSQDIFESLEVNFIAHVSLELVVGDWVINRALLSFLNQLAAKTGLIKSTFQVE